MTAATTSARSGSAGPAGPRHLLPPWFLWGALAVVLVTALAVGARANHDPTLSDRVATIGRSIKCPQCSDESVANSDAPASVAARAQIAQQLQQGRNPDQIRAWFASRYGSEILLTPKASGTDSLVWVLPVVAGVLAVFGLGLAFWRWHEQEPVEASSDDEARVEEELARRSGP